MSDSSHLNTVAAQAATIVELRAQLAERDERIVGLEGALERFKAERVQNLIDLSVARGTVQELQDVLQNEASGTGVEELPAGYEGMRRARLAQHAGYRLDCNDAGVWFVDWTDRVQPSEDPLQTLFPAERMLIVHALHDRAERRFASGADGSRSKCLAQRIEDYDGVTSPPLAAVYYADGRADDPYGPLGPGAA